MFLMKVGIITFHFVNNFGGVLQAYAFQNFLTDEFHVECKIIDYRHWFIRLTDAARRFPLTDPSKCLGPWSHTIGERKERKRKFERFIKKHENLTKYYRTYHRLKRNEDKFDLIICGSDQIWNPYLTLGPAKAYYARFADGSVRKISYAASVGNPPFFRDRIAGYVRSLDDVSIREQTTWLEDCLEEKPGYNVDPTFLLKREKWDSLCSKPVSTEPYILIYLMQSNNEAYDVIQKIQKATGYRTYDISRYGYNPGFIDKTIVDVGPEDFLGLIKNAAYVCTNSFHGLVFSIIFNKRVSLIPIKRFSYRIDDLCSMLNAKRISMEDGRYFEVEYDPVQVDEIMASKRAEAVEYIKRNINHVQHQ